ncbi:hypothetical protein ACO0KY_18645, partial [Undibacterium sp. Dicai25W]|uniref:hypothetical protein n=1 Tax=Undibacterium sp. Dicai25W TaxID=3413034 RepID=UPI003BF3C06D
ILQIANIGGIAARSFKIKLLSITDRSNGKLWTKNVPVSIHFSVDDAESESLAKQHALFLANENATSYAHDNIFLNRVAEFASRFPGTFQKIRFVSDDDLNSGTIFPSWRFEILSNLILKDRAAMPPIFAICRIWSFWDVERAATYLRLARLLYGAYSELELSLPLSMEDFINAYEAKYGIGSSLEHFTEMSEYLSISKIAKLSPTSGRGFFASLLCFCPPSLHAAPLKHEAIAWLAKKFGEDEEVRKRISQFLPKLDQHDQDYVLNSHPNVLGELLCSLFLVASEGNLHLEFKKYVESGLRCFSESVLEEWTPSNQMSPTLINAFM